MRFDCRKGQLQGAATCPRMDGRFLSGFEGIQQGIHVPIKREVKATIPVIEVA
jgi:hypothetical protein